MKTLDLTVDVPEQRTVTLKLPDDVAPGWHRMVVVIEDRSEGRPRFNPEGLWRGADVTGEVIAEARREMWGKFDR